MKQLFYFLIIIGLILACNKDKNEEKFTIISIVTKDANYYYQSDAGGFSSIIDNEGNDWVNFKYDKDVEYPKGSESMFRGIPNLVFQGKNDGVGHPGFNKCKSILVNDSTIRTVSNDSLWEYKLYFHSNYVYFHMIKTDSLQNYWFLYEGIPNGMWNPEKYFWGNNLSGPISKLPNIYNKKPEYGNWDWVYFGTTGYSNIFFIAQVQSDTLIDLCGFLGNNSEKGLKSKDGMVVMGFGRENTKKPIALLKKPQDFIFGFIETEKEIEHKKIKEHIEKILIKYK